MIARKKFLTTLFASLDEHGVRYCVLRNYHNLYTASDTDLDLLVSPWSVARFERCLREAAAANGFRLVHSVRYVNYSHVYWHPRLGFIRIDFETEIRWGQFQVLDARRLLDARVRHQEFFIPPPADESVIVFVAAIWRCALSERYRRRLGELFDASADKVKLRQILREAFGGAGAALFDFQSRVATAEFSRGFCNRVRRSIILANFSRLRSFFALTWNIETDVRRLWKRLRQPAGVSLLHVSARDREQNFSDLTRRIEFLFPAQKCIFQSFDFTKKLFAAAPWGLNLRWLRARALFKGGLFVRAYRLPRNQDLLSVIRTHSRYSYPSRSFVCMEDSAGKLYFAHLGTGFMAEVSPQPGISEVDFSQSLIEFLADTLERQVAASVRPQRGRFGVLVGLDGAGKTTLARSLCGLLAPESRFSGVRYFHWRPQIFGGPELPLPAFEDQPRKKELRRNLFNSCLSAARLIKNALQARVAYHWTVGGLVRKGRLVLVDRYFYNYYLDPVSVKYTGPLWLLDIVRRWFPRPDFVITLAAPPEVLLRRKQELSEPEMRRQSAELKKLPFDTIPVIAADATQTAPDVAAQTLNALLKTIA